MVIIIILFMWIVSFLSPELTTRRYMLTRLHLGSVFTSNITDMNRYDRHYGHEYDVTNFVDRTTGGSMGTFYLSKFGPFWVVSSVGTAP
ncbi:hypothetical protein SAMN05216378_0346 [Paenibacillus catalpae]|uniref:Uncharacterized protein n=1 Tax=Paenibacillus catalpae TaxID=1045775 RepID=A0A1I1T3X0_9BACL|nr:hypothetical protein SAMN05216378_0346 [Paenibacillus catalpae]